MYRHEVRDFDEWRSAARPLLAASIPPADVIWSDWRTPALDYPSPVDSHTLPLEPPDAMPRSHAAARPPAISRRLLKLLEDLACYRDAARWEFMYRLTWRVLNENSNLLDNDADPDVQRARLWEKAIHRDIHKMHAFVRFHETDSGDGDKRYIAWFEPSHEILRNTVPFFEKRFPNMRWMIATPDGAAV